MDLRPSPLTRIPSLRSESDLSPQAGRGELAAPLNPLVIVARNPHGLRQALVLRGRREHHAVGELLHHGALDLLPRRLARRIAVAALLLERRPALRQLRLADEDVGGALVEVDAHAVAGLKQRQA